MKAQVKRYLTTMPRVWLCSVALRADVYFPLAAGFYSEATGARTGGPCGHFSSSYTTCILQVDSLTLSSPSICNMFQGLHSCNQFSANKQSAHCLYKYIPILFDVWPRCQMSRERTDAAGVGAELQLGIKMPTLHYGWSRSLLLAAWGWG